MSATTMAVAVIHDTVPADTPLKAESVMDEVSSPGTGGITGRNLLKFKEQFDLLRRPKGLTQSLSLIHI